MFVVANTESYPVRKGTASFIRKPKREYIAPTLGDAFFSYTQQAPCRNGCQSTELQWREGLLSKYCTPQGLQSGRASDAKIWNLENISIGSRDYLEAPLQVRLVSGYDFWLFS